MPLRMSVRPTASHTRTRSEPGSSSRQRRDHSRRQSRRHRSRYPHTGVASEFDLDRGLRQYGDAITSRRHQHLRKAIRRGPKIPPPDQTRRHVGLTRHLAHYRTGPECRRHNRLLLLDAPPPTPLWTSQYLDACHRTVSCIGANTGVAPLRNHTTSNPQMKGALRRRGTKRLGVSRKSLPPRKRGTRWDQVLFVLVAYRLLAPGSEWRLHRK
jgi:hypothetical protein